MLKTQAAILTQSTQSVLLLMNIEHLILFYGDEERERCFEDQNKTWRFQIIEYLVVVSSSQLDVFCNLEDVLSLIKRCFLSSNKSQKHTPAFVDTQAVLGYIPDAHLTWGSYLDE